MKRKAELSAEVKKQIADLYVRGRTYRAIMRKLKVTTAEVARVRDEFGLTPRLKPDAGQGRAAASGNGRLPASVAAVPDKIGGALRRAAEELSALGVSSVVIDLIDGTYTINATTLFCGKLT